MKMIVARTISPPFHIRKPDQASDLGVDLKMKFQLLAFLTLITHLKVGAVTDCSERVGSITKGLPENIRLYGDCPLTAEEDHKIIEAINKAPNPYERAMVFFEDGRHCDLVNVQGTEINEEIQKAYIQSCPLSEAEIKTLLEPTKTSGNFCIQSKALRKFADLLRLVGQEGSILPDSLECYKGIEAALPRLLDYELKVATRPGGRATPSWPPAITQLMTSHPRAMGNLERTMMSVVTSGDSQISLFKAILNLDQHVEFQPLLKSLAMMVASTTPNTNRAQLKAKLAAVGRDTVETIYNELKDDPHQLLGSGIEIERLGKFLKKRDEGVKVKTTTEIVSETTVNDISKQIGDVANIPVPPPFTGYDGQSTETVNDVTKPVDNVFKPPLPPPQKVNSPSTDKRKNWLQTAGEPQKTVVPKTEDMKVLAKNKGMLKDHLSTLGEVLANRRAVITESEVSNTESEWDR